MRVVHVTPYFAPAFSYGGPPRSILGLSKALVRAKVDVEVVTTTANGAADLPASRNGGELFEDVRVRYLPRAWPRRLFAARGLARELASAAARADIVHVHGLWNAPAWLGAHEARAADRPYVLAPRGMLQPGALAHRAWRKRVAYPIIERRNLQRAALLHATSAAERRTLERLGLDVPIAMIPNGVDVGGAASAPHGALRRRLGLDGRAPLVLFLGRVHPIKRLDLLALAFERVLTSVSDAHLVLAGPVDWSYRRQLEPLFARSAAAVHWLGEVGQSEKWEVFADANVFVMCSNSESFGTTVVEAMASGVPIVVTDTCPWEEVESIGCGHWISQRPGAIADALVRVLSNTAAATAMGERGRAAARARYDWDWIASLMIDHYARAIAAARAGTRS